MTMKAFHPGQLASGLWIIAVVALFTPIGVTTTQALERDRDHHRGYVDGSVLAELANEDDTLIEISIKGPLLRMVAKAIGHESSELSEFLGQIISINAIVLELEGDREPLQPAVGKLVNLLQDKGWERIARVQEDDSYVAVFVLYDSRMEELEGLTVIVSEDGDELVFANIAGRIDLELVGRIGKQLGVPGLDELTGLHLQSAAKDRKIKKERKKRSWRE